VAHEFASVSLFKFVFKMLLKKNYEVRIISIKELSGTDYVDFTNIRLLGRERTANGTLEVKKDLSDDLYSLLAETFSDPNGNGEFKQLPMFIPRQPICKAMESYSKYIEASFKYGVNTDFPVHPCPCPIPKGLYYVKNVTAQTDDWPVIMPRGFLKAVLTLYYDNEVASTTEIVVQISDLSE
ncbi:hypothetical protein KR038_007130, partial [Drosophila bunnanda]